MKDRKQLEKILLLKREVKIRESRKSFYEFCKTLTPNFYTDDKTYLKKLCDLMQGLYEKKLLRKDGLPYRKMLLSVPP